MKWAGGAGRREGVHMVHTFEKVRTRTPANPNEAAPEAIMAQAAWEALLRDAVQGLRPPYNPQALRQWLQATHPTAWAIGAPRPTPPPPHREGEGHGQGEGKGQQGTLRQRGTEGPQVRGRRPYGQGTGRDRTWGQETTQRPGRGRSGDRGTEEQGTTADATTHTQEGHTTTEGPAPPQPQRTPHDSRGRTPPTRTAEARIGRRTDHTSAHPPAVIEIKSPRKCFPLSLIVVDAKADLQTKASNGHGQGLSQKLIAFEPVSPLLDSSANKHG